MVRRLFEFGVFAFRFFHGLRFKILGVTIEADE